MKAGQVFRVIFYLLLQSNLLSAQVNDSIWNTEQLSKRWNTEFFAATSFLLNNNWKGSDNSSIILTGSFNLNFKKKSEGLLRMHELRTELSYMKFIDSLWVKNTDNFILSNNWILNDHRFMRNSISIIFKSQITDTWENNPHNKQSRKWKSGPLLPATFTTGYGLNILLGDNNFLNFSFAALRVLTQPRNKIIQEDKKVFAKTENAVLSSEYGFNFQSSIDKKICKNIRWENKSTLFGTGLDKETISLDMQNIISIYPANHIKIRFDLRMVYDFKTSTRFQNRFELLAGYYLGKMNK